MEHFIFAENRARQERRAGRLAFSPISTSIRLTSKECAPCDWPPSLNSQEIVTAARAVECAPTGSYTRICDAPNQASVFGILMISTLSAISTPLDVPITCEKLNSSSEKLDAALMSSSEKCQFLANISMIIPSRDFE